ncbi:pilin N-terminal domain-containing protein [Mobiluncus mulieris]|uniref:pilin N-terminal domain-containing protein n=1 Tax=Mobiluncus mulieris TaxID=2052 RepID=UPI002430A021|nr:pilin N-terminal domain-containing protein [Mobiluncus mulieris]
MKQWGRWLAVIAACALVTVANPFGAEASDTLPAIAPAGSTHGPITGDGDSKTILKKGAPTGSGTLTVQLYQGNLYDDVKAPNSVGVKIKLAKVKGVTLTDSASWSDIKNLSIAQATQKGLETPTTATTDNNGKVKFENLAVGLYLVSPQETNTSFHPFLVTMPVADQNGWNFSLKLYPKPVSAPARPTPKPTKTKPAVNPKPTKTGETVATTHPTAPAHPKPTHTESSGSYPYYIPEDSSPSPTAKPSNPTTEATKSDGNRSESTGDESADKSAEPKDTPKAEKNGAPPNTEQPPVGGVWMRAPNGDMILVAPNGEIIARLPATGVVATQIGGAALVLLALGMAILAWARRRAKRENDASHT